MPYRDENEKVWNMMVHAKPKKKLLISGVIIALITLGTAVFAEEGRAGFNSQSEQTLYDSDGRYILHGDPSARPSPHHSGGGITTSAARYFLRIADRGPFRIEGDWFSSGTMVLALVVGPDAVGGSCIGDAVFSFHEAIPLTGDNSDLNQNRGYSGVFTRPLRDWYHTMRSGGGMSYVNSMTLDQNDLAGFGYPVCEDAQ